ncbi:hypothetical protein SAMN04489713_12172 [Actinomadura madurae]|uniref:Uncharacterized protein n=1 Tax=Actinomadura madurae TaxID=1993 RepID=A0A1I5VC03_9ACTN|nr:hypothetical protein [Actinomadura madurae]SFQ05043.1 hypothetical protein SAMN04489713_12172 [Actinomadura madurae]
MKPNWEEPFDRSLPSPLKAVAALRSAGEDSVVSTKTMTSRQKLMYITTGLEDRLARRMLGPRAPALLLLSGSSGGGKSALIRMLEQTVPPNTFTTVVEDATHAEAPDADQTRYLAQVLAGFNDGVPGPGVHILLAANTGLLLRLERMFKLAAHPALAELVAFALRRLGVPAASPVPASRAEELRDTVLVVDLDQRPTSGGEDRLFRRMLPVLEPDAPNGVLAGAGRCDTCQVRAFCAPRTNLELLADPEIGAVLDEAVDQVALRRGRDVPPRQFWDALGALALGGLQVPPGADPCEGVAALAARNDLDGVWRSLLPNGVFTKHDANPLCADLAALDPAFAPSLEGHDIIASAGVDPEGDASSLVDMLGDANRRREAVATAASALATGQVLGGPAAVARGLARASWLAGKLLLQTAASTIFEQALGGDETAIDKVVRVTAQGIVSSFGRYVEGSYYLPTESLAQRRDSRVLVRVELDEMLDWQPSVPEKENPWGSEIVGLRPLTARILIGNSDMVLDLPLYELLERAASGTNAASVDIERFHSLRHAVETLGRTRADDRDAPLLIVRDGGREAYRAKTSLWRGQQTFRITKVG